MGAFFRLSTTVPRRLATIGLLAAVCAALVHGQETATPTPNGAASDEPTPALTPADVQRELETLADLSELAEATQTRITEAYQRALTATQTTQTLREQIRQYDTAREQAPERVAELQATLAKPAEPVAITAPPDAELTVLEADLSAAAAAQDAAEQALAQIEAERERRSQRRVQIPQELTESRQRLEQLRSEPLPPAGEGPGATQAQVAESLLRRAQIEQAEARIAALEAELRSYEARSELLSLRRDLAARELKRVTAVEQAWREIVNRKRAAQAAERRKEAEALEKQAAELPAPVRRLAENNAQLAKQNQELEQRLRTVRSAVEAVEQESRAFDEARSRIQNQIEMIGLTEEVGRALRNQREQLERTRELERELAQHRTELGQTALATNRLTDQRRALADIDTLVSETLGEIDQPLDDARRETLAEETRSLAQKGRATLQDLLENYESLQTELARLVTMEGLLLKRMNEFATYVDRRVLWIRSADWPGVTTLRNAWEALQTLVRPENWGAVGQTLWRSVQDAFFSTVVFATAFVVLILSRRRIQQRLRAAGEIAARPTSYAFKPTLVALSLTLLRAIVWPSLLFFVGWHLTRRVDAPDFARAVGTAAQQIAFGLLIAMFFWRMCRPKGLAEAHFDWSSRVLRRVTAELAWFVPLGLTVVAVYYVVEWTRDPDYQASLGRFAFIVVQGLTALFVWRLFGPRSALREQFAKEPGSWLDRTQQIWPVFLAAIPLALAMLSIAGYHYTATQLSSGVRATLGLILVLVVLNSLALRWILTSNRKLAIEQDRRRRAALREQIAKAAAGQEVNTQDPDESPLDISLVSTQVRNLLKGFTTLALIAGLWGIWADDLPVLTALENVVIWSGDGGDGRPADTVESLASDLDPTTNATGGAGPATEADPAAEPAATETTRDTEVAESAVTLANLLVAILVVIVTLLMAKNLPGLLEIVVLQRLPMQPGERYAISTVVSYFLLIVGFVVSFSVIGIGWSQVQWLVAAISVGLGFGLQEIFANFVSGLIILFERPIRIGDVVTVGNIDGKVTKIRMRATTITDWDRRELVVPNREFITGQLINWTLSDPVTRVVVPVGIAYGSDTRKAETILKKIARECPMVLDQPAPLALFLGFGDSTLNFELRVYIPSRDVWQDLIHYLHTHIDDAFRAAGVEIAFPQRDLHIRSAKDTIKIETVANPMVGRDDRKGD